MKLKPSPVSQHLAARQRSSRIRFRIPKMGQSLLKGKSLTLAVALHQLKTSKISPEESTNRRPAVAQSIHRKITSEESSIDRIALSFEF